MTTKTQISNETRGWAIVTGGANGIGRAITCRLVEDGFSVLVVDLKEEDFRAMATGELENKLLFFAADVSDEKEVEAIFAFFDSLNSPLSLLVNNAGIIRDNNIRRMPVEDFDRVLAVNLRGPWLLCRQAAIRYKKQGFGKIVNIASRAWLGNPGQTNYSASKAGLIGLTRALALELGPDNVQVNAVAPGLINTPLSQSLPPDILQKLIQAQPTRTIGQPEDVAEAVAFLASDKTGFITGQTLYVDGGKSIGAGI